MSRPPRQQEDDPLAYGEDYGQSRGMGQGGSERGFVGDVFRIVKSKLDKHQGTSGQDFGYSSSGGSQQPYYGQSDHTTGYPTIGQSAYPGGPPTQKPSKKPDLASNILGGLHSTIHSIGSDVAGIFSPQHSGKQDTTVDPNIGRNRYDSFASEKTGNDVKWFVDGCGYFWAISQALENAKHTIWILDWWLSPELYLRRPPAHNEQWRLDRVLQRAAQRGVKVNIIVYKEVTQALTLCSHHTKTTLEALSPNIAVFRHPDHLPDLRTAQSSLTSSFQGLKVDAASTSKLGNDSIKGIFGTSDDVILFWAHHEKMCLIDGTTAFMGGLDLCFGRWDTNQHSIADAHSSDLRSIVFPGQDYNNARVMDFSDVTRPFQNKLDRTKSSRMGWSDISVCLQGSSVDDLKHHFIDRWNFIFDEKYNIRKDKRYYRLSDDYGHSHIHPTPVANAQQPYIQTPVPGSNFPPPPGSQSQPTTISQGLSYQSTQNFPPPPPGPPPQSFSSTTQAQQQAGQYGQHENVDPAQSPYVAYSGETPYTSAGHGGPQAYQHPVYQPAQYSQARGTDDYQQHRAGEHEYETHKGQGVERGFGGSQGFMGKFDQYKHQGQHIGQEFSSIGGKIASGVEHSIFGHTGPGGQPPVQPYGPMSCQVVRSCTKWSNGTPTEQSIQNAYIDIIQKSERFVYIENQFFITATGSNQKPVKNLVGKAIADRIIRAGRNKEQYKVIVVIPSVPAFAGDLRDDSSLGTRAIMEFQYNSINRGGNSIMELIANAGINPMDYIRFYNLRNYDRIDAGTMMKQIEQQSGVKYELARREHDDMVGAGYGDLGEQTGIRDNILGPEYQQYQAVAKAIAKPGAGRWDSVAECYMLDGEDIRSVPWDGSPESELAAFVSEELYIHSKVLIADDRVVICGSANLNDRSQLGYHDSEIAIIVNDPTPIQSFMAGQPWRASRFASSLRRHLFRKHLGLIRPQDMQRPDANFEPVGSPNNYDWGSPEDNIVADPLSNAFQSFWNTRARTNTEVFRKTFRAVPDDLINSWKQYTDFYEYFFHDAEADAEGKDKKPPRVEYGHVVQADFPGGVRELKELLSRVKGTLVEMPLCFLQNEDIAKEGLKLNALTEEIYT